MNDLPGTFLTIAASALSALFGLVYMLRPKFMGYHKLAVQKDWNELPPEIQTLILALMRVTGSGFISVATAIIILQFEFHKNHLHWIAWTILAIGSLLTLGAVYAMLLVRIRTNGRPPILPVLFIFLLLLTGFFFNILL